MEEEGPRLRPLGVFDVITHTCAPPPPQPIPQATVHLLPAQRSAVEVSGSGAEKKTSCHVNRAGLWNLEKV